MTEPQPCPRCSRALNTDAFVCGSCVTEAQKDLAEAADFLLWCDEKRARVGTNWTTGSAGKAAETPLPYDPRVTKVVTPIRNSLTTWARVTVEEYNPEDGPPVELDMLASWLIDFCEWMATKDWGEDAFGEFQDAHERLRSLFDTAPDKVYLGACGAESEQGDCSEAVYAEADAKQATCPRCSHTHSVADRQAELAAGVEAHLGTVKEISRLLRVSLGEDVSVRMIYGYIDHGLIQSHGKRREVMRDGRTRMANIYRIGEVREAVRTLADDRPKRLAIARLAKIFAA